MNLTLSIDARLLKEARKAALEMDTTVNSLVREYLKEIVQKQKTEKVSFLEEWKRLMEKNEIRMKDRTWDRGDLHER